MLLLLFFLQPASNSYANCGLSMFVILYSFKNGIKCRCCYYSSDYYTGFMEEIKNHQS